MRWFLLLLLLPVAAFAQQPKTQNPDSLAMSFDGAVLKAICSCADSISDGQGRATIREKLHECIKKQVISYQIMEGFKEALKGTIAPEGKKKKGKESYKINVSDDENSAGFQRTYYALERMSVDSCPSVRHLLSINDEGGEQLSTDIEARKWYMKGLDAIKEEDYKSALNYYKKAVEADPKFIFAWDNLGLTYRQLEQYDKAIDAYEHSLKIDPNGFMPLQNAAIASSLKKDYAGAIKYYKRIAEIQPNNPEAYYGMGQVYAMEMNDYENALYSMCIAYRLYLAQKSPYRTDAEKIISIIYQEMKKAGKEAQFRKILKEEQLSFGE